MIDDPRESKLAREQEVVVARVSTSTGTYGSECVCSLFSTIVLGCGGGLVGCRRAVRGVFYFLLILCVP